MWNSLEIAKLLISALTPIVVILVGFFINRNLKQLEAIQWANQKVVEKRLAVFDALAPSLNDLLCYFTYIGNWKELSPPKIVEIKRTLDKKAYTNAPLFSRQFLDRYSAFIGTCFRTYWGWGHDAKLRTGTKRRRDAAQADWKPEWDEYSTVAADIPDAEEVREKYNALMKALAQELGVGLVLEGVTYAGRGPILSEGE
jgi:hypothetical protein